MFPTVFSILKTRKCYLKIKEDLNKWEKTHHGNGSGDTIL